MKPSTRLTYLFAITPLILPLFIIPVLANAPPDAEFGGSAGGGILVIPRLFIPGMLLTVVAESFVARLFGIDSLGRKRVRWMNFFSQLLMRVSFLALGAVFSSAKYMTLVLVVEIGVYIGEYLVCRSLLNKMTIIRTLLFTIVANTLSLVLGILLNEFLMI